MVLRIARQATMAALAFVLLALAAPASRASFVILRYRELEPFMVPGPWRDELLKLK